MPSAAALSLSRCRRGALGRDSRRAAQPTAALAAIPRFFVGIPSLFYGVEHLLHPEYVPGIPLQKLTPDWIPGRIFLSYFVGVILILAGVCLLVNKKARMAATSLGLTILLTVLWIYLPMLLAAPTDVVALNFFFDTLLFCGAILLLANAMERKQPWRVTSIRLLRAQGRFAHKLVGSRPA